MGIYVGWRNFFIFRLGLIYSVFVLIGCGGGSSDDNSTDVSFAHIFRKRLIRRQLIPVVFK